jgi:hypothetical protein
MGVTSKPSFLALRQRVIPLRASQGGFEKLLPVAAFRRDPRRYRVSARSSKNFGIFLQVRRNCPYRLQARASTRAGNARNVKSVGIAYATHARPAEFYKFRHPNRSYQRFYGWCLSRQRGRGQFPHTCQAETLQEFFSCREAQSAVHNNPTKTTTEK